MRTLCFTLFCLFPLGLLTAEQPNILWLTCEDTGPHLGCYGDSYADTPHLDAFAKRSLRYLHAWSNAPVCAPARTTLISGLYPPSTGSEHMRSEVPLPADFKMYPAYLREAGYFCVNPGKEDYNLTKVGKVWDQIGKEQPFAELARHQPFMAVFNNTGTHESQIRKRPHTWIHDPAKARVPAYHPDTLETRQDWAQYYDNITEMDKWFQQQLDALAAAGLAENTIVFFYGDHGSGMPRNKRTPTNSGLQVPLLIHIPEKFRELAPSDYTAGGTTERLVSFVDFAPTLLSLAGVQAPKHFQGHAFMGPHAAPPQPYLYGFRARMDERLDIQRSVRNQRYVYVRNYMPHKLPGQFVSYMFETPTTAKWKELYDAGQLNDDQSHFWQPKPTEELYDLESDPDEVHDLAASAEHQQVLTELRQAHRDWELRIRDVTLLPEGEMLARAQKSSPYEVGHNADLPFERILEMAEHATDLNHPDVPFLLQGLTDRDSAVRYWAVTGLRVHGSGAMVQADKQLQQMLQADQSVYVRNAVAEALALFGSEVDRAAALQQLVNNADADRYGVHAAVQALNTIDELGTLAKSFQPQVQQLPLEGAWSKGRYGTYVPRLVDAILAP